MDIEMIERVAETMVKAMQKLPPNNSNALLVAVECIKAMREPTEKMLKAEGVHCNCFTCGGHKEGYQLMIDAVLK